MVLQVFVQENISNQFLNIHEIKSRLWCQNQDVIFFLKNFAGDYQSFSFNFWFRLQDFKIGIGHQVKFLKINQGQEYMEINIKQIQEQQFEFIANDQTIAILTNYYDVQMQNVDFYQVQDLEWNFFSIIYHYNTQSLQSLIYIQLNGEFKKFVSQVIWASKYVIAQLCFEDQIYDGSVFFENFTLREVQISDLLIPDNQNEFLYQNAQEIERVLFKIYFPSLNQSNRNFILSQQYQSEIFFIENLTYPKFLPFQDGTSGFVFYQGRHLLKFQYFNDSSVSQSYGIYLHLGFENINFPQTDFYFYGRIRKDFKIFEEQINSNAVLYFKNFNTLQNQVFRIGDSFQFLDKNIDQNYVQFFKSEQDIFDFKILMEIKNQIDWRAFNNDRFSINRKFSYRLFGQTYQLFDDLTGNQLVHQQILNLNEKTVLYPSDQHIMGFYQENLSPKFQIFLYQIVIFNTFTFQEDSDQTKIFLDMKINCFTRHNQINQMVQRQDSEMYFRLHTEDDFMQKLELNSENYEYCDIENCSGCVNKICYQCDKQMALQQNKCTTCQNDQQNKYYDYYLKRCIDFQTDTELKFDAQGKLLQESADFVQTIFSNISESFQINIKYEQVIDSKLKIFQINLNSFFENFNVQDIVDTLTKTQLTQQAQVFINFFQINQQEAYKYQQLNLIRLCSKKNEVLQFYDFDKYVCTDLCFQGFYIEKSVCRACGKGCELCEYFGKCLKCQIGYDLFKDVCIQNNFSQNCRDFDHFCMKCQENQLSFCQECMNGYFLNETTKFCEKNCILLVDFCMQCMTDIQSQCALCHTGYYLDQGKCKKSCTLIDPYSISCQQDDLANVDKCQENFFLNLNFCQSQQCQVPNCQKCDDPFYNICLLCRTNFYLQNNQCLFQQCLTNDENCAACHLTSSDICVSCVEGYYLEKNKCQKSAVLKDKYCIQNNQYTQGYCDLCLEDYFLDTDGVCKPNCKYSDQNCLYCNINFPYQCHNCKQNFELSNSFCVKSGCQKNQGTLLCSINQPSIPVACAGNYQLIQDECVFGCSFELQNCLVCEQEYNKCSLCEKGYYINENYHCVQNCLQIEGAQQCKEDQPSQISRCQSNYTLKDNFCYLQCQQYCQDCIYLNLPTIGKPQTLCKTCENKFQLNDDNKACLPELCQSEFCITCQTNIAFGCQACMNCYTVLVTQNQINQNFDEINVYEFGAKLSFTIVSQRAISDKNQEQLVAVGQNHKIIQKSYMNQTIKVDFCEKGYVLYNNICQKLLDYCYIGCFQCINQDNFCLSCKRFFNLINNKCVPSKEVKILDDMQKIQKYFKYPITSCYSVKNEILIYEQQLIDDEVHPQNNQQIDVAYLFEQDCNDVKKCMQFFSVQIFEKLKTNIKYTNCQDQKKIVYQTLINDSSQVRFLLNDYCQKNVAKKNIQEERICIDQNCLQFYQKYDIQITKNINNCKKYYSVANTITSIKYKKQTLQNCNVCQTFDDLQCRENQRCKEICLLKLQKLSDINYIIRVENNDSEVEFYFKNLSRYKKYYEINIQKNQIQLILLDNSKSAKNIYIDRYDISFALNCTTNTSYLFQLKSNTNINESQIMQIKKQLSAILHSFLSIFNFFGFFLVNMFAQYFQFNCLFSNFIYLNIDGGDLFSRFSQFLVEKKSISTVEFPQKIYKGTFYDIRNVLFNNIGGFVYTLFVFLHIIQKFIHQCILLKNKLHLKKTSKLVLIIKNVDFQLKKLNFLLWNLKILNLCHHLLYVSDNSVNPFFQQNLVQILFLLISLYSFFDVLYRKIKYVFKEFKKNSLFKVITNDYYQKYNQKLVLLELVQTLFNFTIVCLIIFYRKYKILSLISSLTFLQLFIIILLIEYSHVLRYIFILRIAALQSFQLWILILIKSSNTIQAPHLALDAFYFLTNLLKLLEMIFTKLQLKKLNNETPLQKDNNSHIKQNVERQNNQIYFQIFILSI